MRKAFAGFRTFVLRGNVMDLAVGIIIGTAFGAVVNSFVKDVLMQLIAAAVGRPDFSNLHAGPVRYGSFLTAVTYFVLVAAAIYFFLVIPVNRLMERFFPHTDSEAPKKICPECLSNIPAAATRCAFCTAPLGPPASPPAASPSGTSA